MAGILLVTGGLIAAVLGVGALLLYDANQARACTWREAAKAVDMTGVVESRGFFGFHHGLSGRAGDLRVRIEPYGTGRHVAGTRVRIAGLGHASGKSPFGFRFSWEQARSRFPAWSVAGGLATSFRRHWPRTKRRPWAPAPRSSGRPSPTWTGRDEPTPHSGVCEVMPGIG